MVKSNETLDVSYKKIIDKEWDFTNNTEEPSTILTSSMKKVFWLCPKGHSYKKEVNNKIKKRFSYELCEECLSLMWANENNKISLDQAINVPDEDYYFVCEKHGLFHVPITNLYCPSCKRDDLISEYEEEVPGIFDSFILNPYEEYIFDLLKDYDLSSYDETKNKNIKFLTKGKETGVTTTHFGVKTPKSSYLKLSKDNYIDRTIFDDIYRRKMIFNQYYFRKCNHYHDLYVKLIESKKFKECKEGITDLSLDFKKTIFLFCMEHFWGNYFNLLDSFMNFYEMNFYIPKDKVKELFNNAVTLKDKIAVGDYLAAHCNQKRYKGYTGIDFLLGNISKEMHELHIDDAYRNFDINMNKMKSNNHDEFNDYISDFTVKNGFEEISDLNVCSKKTGIYLMILDEYNSVYIGQASDITSRIKKHWGNNYAKPLGRLIFGSVEDSSISVNSFGPLDTTRIFVKYTDSSELNDTEYDLINSVEPKYDINRIAGGDIKENYIREDRDVFLHHSNSLFE